MTNHEHLEILKYILTQVDSNMQGHSNPGQSYSTIRPLLDEFAHLYKDTEDEEEEVSSKGLAT